MAVVDITGARFGRLTVFERMPNRKDGTSTWRVICDCGQSRIVDGTGLRAGRNKSCGCASPRFQPVHGLNHRSGSGRTYGVWRGMHARCLDANGKKAHLYAGKGIKVCERWKDFANFLADMGEVPEGMSIDRIEGNKGYEPGNCRWADGITQANNTSANRQLAYDGRTQTMSMWARELGIKANTIICRLRRGWGIEMALGTPVMSRKS